ncbi:hypothetical protein JVT61DRAFT_13760 [Boletus reticuloceps]|uniref:G domain-containing protein n=1 Tax=Boletus reticuloceps TaxID=495285 RepID=A0A8I2YVE6_9AGAM|nr:hypothetical protein JVT61DRAFT_13760 [Boletus reticuloceps]
MTLKSDSSKLRIQRNIVFFGETGAGKSSAINLLLGTGTTAPVSNDTHLCTKASASYETMLNGTKYNLWDTRGLGGARGFFHTFPFLGTFFGGGSSEKELKKILKERHANHEIDLLVYCVRGSRASKASLRYYSDFCVITRRLAAPVVIVVTHLEKEMDMEDWWCRNSADLKKLEMEFDDHVCITTLPEHHRRDASKKKLVDLVSKDRRWEAKESGSYFGSPVQKPTPAPVPAAPPRKRGLLDLRKATGRASVGDESISRCPSNSSGSSGCAPSTTSSSYHTAGSPTESMLPSPIVEPPTPRIATTSIKVPHINTNLLRTGDRPQPPSEETSSSMADSSMFYTSSHSSYTSYSEVYLESCTEENEVNYPSDLQLLLFEEGKVGLVETVLLEMSGSAT